MRSGGDGDLGGMARVFYKIGAFAANRPLTVNVTCLVFTVLCALGMLKVVIETSPQEIWVPPASTTKLEKNYFDDNFNPFFRIEQLFFVADEPGVDMVQKSYLQKVLAIQKELESAIVVHEGQNVTLDDLCFKPIQGKGCLITSPGQFWLMRHSTLANDPSVSLTASCQTEDEFLKSRSPCMDQIGTPVMPRVVFGGIGANPQVVNPDPCGSKVPSARGLVLTLLLNSYDDPAYLAKAKAWEKEVFLRIAEESKSRLANDVHVPMTLTYLSERSVEDSLQTETTENTWVVAVSYVCMLIYISVALGKFPDLVRSRFLIGLLGILIVVSSLAISLGLLSLFGLHTTLIIWEVVPFLILAIGVDNMFIISREFDRLRMEKQDEPLAHVMGMTLAGVGPSILAAAGSECLAFAVSQSCLLQTALVMWIIHGSINRAYFDCITYDNECEVGALTNIPALQQFCTVAAVAVLADFVLQLTWFVAGLAMDTRRVAANRYDAMPCLVRRPRKQGLLLETDQDGSAAVNEDNDPENLSLITKWIDRFYLPCLFSPVGKATAILLYLTFLALGIVGLTKLELGLEPQLAAPTNFYLVDYYNTEFSLGEAGPPAYIVLKDLDYAQADVREKIRDVTTSLSFLQEYVQTPIYSWIDAVDAFNASANAGISLPSDCPTVDPSASYYSFTRTFLNISIDSQCCQSSGICGEQYVSDVSFETDEPDSPIKASRLRMQLQPLRNESAFISSYYYLRNYVEQLAQEIPEAYKGQRTAQGTSNVAFPYSLYFVFYEQYTYIQGVAITNLLLALAAVFLSTALITNVPTAFCIIGMVTSIIVDVVGVLYLWNLSAKPTGYEIRINAVSVVNIVMGVGLSVEFVVHIASAFLFTAGTRESRAKAALTSMGASVFSGITLTKLVGISVLAVAPSHLFRVYYFRMYTALIIMGAFEGLAFFPVFLSFMGPAARMEHGKSRD